MLSHLRPSKAATYAVIPLIICAIKFILDQEPVPHNGKWHAAKCLHEETQFWGIKRQL